MRQAPNLESILCKSKFMQVEETFYVTSSGKIASAAHIC